MCQFNKHARGSARPRNVGLTEWLCFAGACLVWAVLVTLVWMGGRR